MRLAITLTEINTQRREGESGSGGLLTEDRVRGMMRLAVTLMNVTNGGEGIVFALLSAVDK
jgi:hypothetical protein